MGIKRIKPVTPGQRFKLAVTFEALTASRPEKSLLAPIKRTGGRNDTGKMTMRNRGGGHKRRYRIMTNLIAMIKLARRIKNQAEYH